ncbi:hypothetical protein BDZ91DRAFT_658850, partial [Kalaharituber pfeilii]
MKPTERIAYDAVFYTLALIFLLLRFGIRLTPTSLRRTMQNPTIPSILADVLMLLALLITTGAIAADIWLQRRTIQLQNDPAGFLKLLDLYPIGMKIAFANQLCWLFLMWSVKGALMCLYYDISRHVQKRVKILMHITSVVLVTTMFAILGTFIGWCRPIETNWTIGAEMCTPQAHIFPVVFTSVLHIVTDLMILTVPLLILRTLKLARREHYALYFIFGIGFLTVGVAIVSLALQIEIVRLDSRSLGYLTDMEVKVERVYLSAIAESSIAMVGACLPSLRVFLRR